MPRDFHQSLAEGVLVFDGAMGTCLYQRGVHLGKCYDALNLEDPEMVGQVHADYVRAGAQALQTNTFGANAFKLARHHLAERMSEINRRGAEIAREAAGEKLMVAGSIGPVGVKLEPWGPTSHEQARAAFAEQAAALAEGGADLYVLETFSDPGELRDAIAGAREGGPGLPILAQMTVAPDGSTLYGTPIEEILPRIEEAGPDALGLNCSIGPQLMLEALERILEVLELPVSVQPNAGFPKRLDERYFYLSSPDYFARYGRRFVEAGARIVGGCCGTTPDHIRALSRALRVTRVQNRRIDARTSSPKRARRTVAKVPMSEKSRLGAKIAAGEPVACVELLSPRGWGLEKILAMTAELEAAGFDAVNIPDGPRATARMSPLATAVRIQQESGRMETVLHYVCRDRNLLGMQADLLGAYALGLRNLLLITGDPLVKGDYPEATPVFDVDSVGLTNLVSRLNAGCDIGDREIDRPTGFLIGVGANPTAVSFERELERFYWKVDAGAEFAMTQPVFDPEALDRFLDAVEDFAIPVLAGIWPLQSLRNAEFLHNEVPGISIPPSIMERMRSAAGRAEEERETGLRIALEMARAVLPRVGGIQVSAPFNRSEVAKRLLLELGPLIGRPSPGDAP